MEAKKAYSVRYSLPVGHSEHRFPLPTTAREFIGFLIQCKDDHYLVDFSLVVNNSIIISAAPVISFSNLHFGRGEFFQYRIILTGKDVIQLVFNNNGANTVDIYFTVVYLEGRKLPV